MKCKESINVQMSPCVHVKCSFAFFLKRGETKGEIYRGREGRINTETEKNKKRGIYRD